MQGGHLGCVRLCLHILGISLVYVLLLLLFFSPMVIKFSIIKNLAGRIELYVRYICLLQGVVQISADVIQCAVTPVVPIEGSRFHVE